MLSPGGPFLLALGLCQALALPLTTQRPKEDEKVTKCITEILVDALSKPSPIPATNDCLEILKEDERALAVLHHQNLLKELEELAHRENTKHHLGHEGGPAVWEGKDEGEEEEEVKKRSKTSSQQGEAASEETEEKNERRNEEEQEGQQHEKTEEAEEKVKEGKVARGEENQEALEEEVKALMDQEKQEEEEEKEARKKRSSSETWSSKEYFGHISRRDPGQPQIQEGMLRGNQDGGGRNGLAKRPLRLEEEEGESSEEEPFGQGGHSRGGRHPEGLEEEEEEERKAEPAKREAEKASDEETAQFEEEEKGLSSAQRRRHGGRKPWGKEQEGEQRHGPHHGLDLKRRYQVDAVSLQGRPYGHEGEGEDRGAHPQEVLDLEKLEEIVQELKRAAEKLEELKKG